MLTVTSTKITANDNKNYHIEQMRRLVHTVVQHTNSSQLDPETKKAIWPIVREFYVDMRNTLDRLTHPQLGVAEVAPGETGDGTSTTDVMSM